MLNHPCGTFPPELLPDLFLIPDHGNLDYSPDLCINQDETPIKNQDNCNQLHLGIIDTIPPAVQETLAGLDQLLKLRVTPGNCNAATGLAVSTLAWAGLGPLVEELDRYVG